MLLPPPIAPLRTRSAQVGPGGLFEVRRAPPLSSRGPFVGVLVALVGVTGFVGGYCLGSPEPAIVVAAPVPIMMPSAATRTPDPVPAVAPAAPSASVAKRPAWAVAPPPSTAWRPPGPGTGSGARPVAPASTASARASAAAAESSTVASASPIASASTDDRLLDEMRRAVAKGH